MAFTTPSSLNIVKQSQLLLAPLAKQPLQLALENLNYLYRFHLLHQKKQGWHQHLLRRQ